MTYKPPTIQEEGLKNYLERKGYDYKELAKLVKGKVSYSAIARLMNVNRRTAQHWVEIYLAEKDSD